MPTATLNRPTLLNPTEAAKFLGVTSDTLCIWRCTQRYPLNYVKVGGRVMYIESDLIDFIESRTVRPDGEAR
jgi:hypothetical protein